MDNVHLEEIIERVRKGALAESARQVVDLATSPDDRERDGQPSKPDDLSLILFRKPDRTRIIER